MTKSKKTDKTMVDEILHRKLKIGQPKAHWKFQIGKRMSCSPSGTCCVTVKWQDYNLIWKSCWIWIPYKMGVKTIRTSYLHGNRSGHHNTKLKTWKHVIEQNEQEKPYLKTGTNSGALNKSAISGSLVAPIVVLPMFKIWR
jgi:hypothetical protein